MGSDEALLPVIDFSELKPGTPEWDSARARVQQALQEYGSFEALYNKIPSELLKSLFAAIKEIFELPFQTKSGVLISSKTPFGGYTAPSATSLWETMAIRDVLIPEKLTSFSNLLWPGGNPSFDKTVLYYSEQVSELDKMIRRMVLEIFGVEKYYEELIDSSRYSIRVMKYEAQENMESKMMLSAHTDTNFMTILHQNEVDGLEVQSRDGKWITLKPSSGSFVVLPGDSFYAWTNGRLHAPFHRVVMIGNKTRYSAGLFCSPKQGYAVKAPDELVDEEHPLRFKPYEYMEYLTFVQAQIERKAEININLFCGV